MSNFKRSVRVGLPEDSSVRFIRERAKPGDREGFMAAHLESFILTRRGGNRDSVARVFLMTDMDGDLNASPDAKVDSGETMFPLRREATEEFFAGRGRIQAPDLNIGVHAVNPWLMTFEIDTSRPLIVVENDTYREVVAGARRNNGKNFCFPSLTDMFRGFRGLGPRTQVWHVGLGKDIERADTTENVWAKRLEGRPHIGYRFSPTRPDHLVDRRR